jgi:hypothetical protein
MAITTLGHSVSLDDIKDWSSAGNIDFRITRKSELALFSEGLAIARLHELARAGITISVELTFAIPMDILGKSDVDLAGLGLLGSLFGLALVSYAKTVMDANGADIRSSLFAGLWRLVQSFGGVLSSGSKQYIVFRDPDYAIPQCLRETDRNSFPMFSRYRTVVSRLGVSITNRSGLSASQSENQLLTFLYEATATCHEHARVHGRSGIRGIIVEKLFYNKFEQFSQRVTVPALAHPYVQGVWEENKGDLMFMAITVADFGPGIHNTLPQRHSESPWERLNRALVAGESRKPKASSLSVGQGFTKILGAARDLKAFLLVRSAEFVGYRNFFHDGLGDADVVPLRQVDTGQGSIGSSVTLLWPIPRISPDQQELFSRAMDFLP